ncbi:hypothetical protein ABID23_001453 [Bartonella silvatica]|uniref:Uncharacterized protein n=1 Tax=Bartonella silvatica TaxID=357760 RepID=A0ABV2HJH6_9HYPH
MDAIGFFAVSYDLELRIFFLKNIGLKAVDKRWFQKSLTMLS